ncbi:hypothetical protein [Stenotrophomonas sp.]|uniref:hypothetical protein n=1 Tax=Stenotrophomonas sp. TaxID=69392 RepID=UPI0028ADB586|nr:hypothetical protein [Stenotrophomonas sp.]
MQIYAAEARRIAGEHVNRLNNRPRAAARSCPQGFDVDTPWKLALALLVISNAAGARTAPTPSAQHAATPAPGAIACVTFPPLSGPVVLRDISDFLVKPLELARQIYYRIEGDGCNPPESPTEEGILQAADIGIGILEATMLGPEATVVKDSVASGLNFAADEMEHKPPRTALQNLLLSLVGLKTGRLEPPAVKPPPLAQLPPLEPRSTSIPIFGRAAQAITRRPALDPTRVEIGTVNHDGVFPYRDTVSGREGRAVQVNGEYFRLHAFTADGAVVEGVSLLRHDGRYRLRVDEPLEEGPVQNDEPGLTAQVRCRRVPGGNCSRNVQYSPSLTEAMRGHHSRGLTEAAARQRGIVRDQLRPGWFIRITGNRRRHYLRFEQPIGQHVTVRYFPVKLHRLGGCTRLSVHLPHRGPAVVDIVRSPATTGPDLMTQGEFNIQFRSFASADASHVYEHAIRAAPDVHLSQPERAAVLRYYGEEESSLEAYVHGDELPAYRRQELGAYAAELDRALLRVPGYAGRVYRGAMLPTDVIDRLEVGQTVRIPGFVRASGERAIGLHQLEGREVPAGQTPVIMEMKMRDGAHPVGLQTLRDESEVIIRRGRVYKVVRNDNGVLGLEEAGRARQAFGPGGAVNLRLS